ncbi:MAG: ABC transporter permease subunit [Chitinispirillia bacterium]|jgi:microcin C transport system permease protein
MYQYVIRRLLLMVPTFIGITFIFFLILQIVPGGPLEQEILKLQKFAMEGGSGGSSLRQEVQISPEIFEKMKKFYGFDKPIVIRYLLWLGIWKRRIDEKKAKINIPYRYNIRYTRHGNDVYEIQKWIKVVKEQNQYIVYESGTGADFAFQDYAELPHYSQIDKWYTSPKWEIKPFSIDSVKMHRTKFSGLITGDLGESYTYREPVLKVIIERLHISTYFGIIGFLISYIISIPLGLIKAVKHTSLFDMSTSVLIFIGYSIPGYLLGALLLVYFGGGSFWDLIPLGNFRSPHFDDLSLPGKIWDQIHHTIAPIIAYSIGSFATLTVLMKNSLMENLGQDYVRTAFSKGLTEERVIVVHALRNSLIPLATGIGGLIGIFFSGSYLIEKTFNIDGIGLLGYRALINRDYPITMGFLVIGTIIKLLGNLISDITLAVVDPRIRFK